MNRFYKRLIYKNGYLLIIAAWFYTLSYVVGNYFNYNNTPLQVKNTLEEYIASQEKNFESITSNVSYFAHLVNENTDKSSLNLYNIPSGIFIYKTKKDSTYKRVFWSRNDMEVFPEELKYKDGYYFVSHTNGYYEYLKKTIRLDTNTFIAAGLIPIKKNYFIENNYLKKTFIADDAISKYYDINFNKGIHVVNSKGKQLFNIDRIGDVNTHSMPVSEAFLKLIAVIFCLIFLNYFVIEIAARKGFKTGFIILLSTLLVIRILSYIFNFPFYFRQFKLFDPTIFSSSVLHPSLGAVVINSLLFLWITKFVRYRFNFNKDFIKEGPNRKIFSYACLIVFILFSYYLFDFIKTLVVDSNIPFNVINFFDLNVYTIVGFFVIAVLILIYYNVTYILLSFVQKDNISILYKLLTTTIVSGFVIFFIPNDFSIYFKIGSFVWLLGYIVYMHYHIQDLEARLIRSPYFLFWIIFYAFSIAFLMLDNDKFEKEKVENIIQNLIYKSVNIDENLVSISTQEIGDDFLRSNFYKFNDSIQNNEVKDSIYQNNLFAYLNSFDINILTYDKKGVPLFNKSKISKGFVDDKIEHEGIEIDVKNLYYIESDTGSNAFALRKEVVENKDTLGYFYLYLPLKNNQDNALYIQLLSKNNTLSNLYDSYYIGFYKKDKITNETSLYNFPDTINSSTLPLGKLKTIESLSGRQYWYKVSNNRTVVVIDKESFVYEYISLFSYLLGFTVLFILIINFLYYIIDARFKWKNLKQNLPLSLRTQIYTTIIFVALFSLVIIGGSTISFNIINYEKENEARLSRVLKRFTKEIEFELNNSSLANQKILNLQEIKEFVTDEILKLASVSNENINFYSPDGNILATSQPYIYNRKILSSQMNPIAYNQMRYLNKNEFYHKENISDFSYLSGYMPLTYENQNIGYVNIPFLNVQSQLNANLSSFITVIICIIALVFMLAGILSIFLTQRILDSFTIIKEKMQRINLGEENEEIVWDKNDEIGAVIEEYNMMLRKLKNSASQLARTEREGAWSEMARQVAHEIKNPLTPMKLNLQFLKRLSESNEKSAKEQSKRISESLIEQIDQLALIASDFSQFANIGQIRPEKFELSEVIKKLIEMYDVNENIKMVYSKNGDDTVYFDKTQTHRLFSNLIKNAIEASAEVGSIIEISIQNFGENVVTSVHDFGIGISREQASKIFIPNFTTKSSGTGLGLAISKVIVENAKGRIWFESIPNIGTTFYVSLPLYR